MCTDFRAAFIYIDISFFLSIFPRVSVGLKFLTRNMSRVFNLFLPLPWIYRNYVYNSKIAMHHFKLQLKLDLQLMGTSYN